MLSSNAYIVREEPLGRTSYRDGYSTTHLKRICRKYNIDLAQCVFGDNDHPVVKYVTMLNACKDTNMSDKLLMPPSSKRSYCPATNERLGHHHVNVTVTEKSATKSCTVKYCDCPCDCCRTGTITKEPCPDMLARFKTPEELDRSSLLKDEYSSLSNTMWSIRDKFVRQSYPLLDKPRTGKLVDGKIPPDNYDPASRAQLDFTFEDNLEANKCGNKFCMCICDCCLPCRFHMKVEHRILFEHWLYYADKVSTYSKVNKVCFMQDINPLSIGAFYSYPALEINPYIRRSGPPVRSLPHDATHKLYDIPNTQLVDDYIVKICCTCFKYVVVNVSNGECNIVLW